MNIQKMMKQAQQMQKKMATIQEELAEKEVTGAAGGGMVEVTLNGKGEARGIKLDPKIVDPEDVEMLEDLIAAAINDAKQKAEAESEAAMKDAMGGLNLPPGMKMPF